MSYGSTVLATGGLKRYWRFNDAGGAANAADATGSADTLTIRSGVTTNQAGGLQDGSGKSFSFLGLSPAYVGNNSYSTLYNLTKPVFEVLFYLGASAPGRALFSLGNESQEFRGYARDTGGNWVFGATKSDGTVLQITVADNNAAFRFSAWNHVVYDPARGRVMVNGVVLADNFNGDLVKTTVNVAFTVGTYKFDGSTFQDLWNQRIAEVAVYDGTAAPWSSQITWDSTAIQHFVEMHALEPATIFSGIGGYAIAASPGAGQSGGAVIQGTGQLIAAGLPGQGQASGAIFSAAGQLSESAGVLITGVAMEMSAVGSIRTEVVRVRSSRDLPLRVKAV